MPWQTGVKGEPAEPFVVSLGVVGFHDGTGPDLRPATRGLRAVVTDVKSRHLQEGWLGWDQWDLLRVTPDGRQRGWVYKDGVVDERRWAEAIDGVPERYDDVLLSSGLWGQVQPEFRS